MDTEPYIFVTVGTTDFDELVKAVDQLAPSLQAKGIMQIGNGQYTPKNWPYFRFDASLDSYYEQAALVIAHGGSGTTTEVLSRNLPLVSVSNPDRYDNHQDDLISALADEGCLVWCRELKDLKQSIETAQTTRLVSYKPDQCEIHLVINKFLGIE